MKFRHAALHLLISNTVVAASAFGGHGRSFLNPTATRSLSTALATSTLANSNVVKKEHQDIHVPVGEDGKGEYTAATKGCFDVIEKATPLVLEATEQTFSRHQEQSNAQKTPFSIADFGTADAGTSLGLMANIVSTIRNQSRDQEIVIQYEDQCTNEWKSVFRHALGEIAVRDAYGNAITSPYVLDDKVFVQACGVGFHQQCFPSNTIDIGVSFTAMHWLSASPNSLRGRSEMHAAQCADKASLPETEQAAADWKSILQARAKELKPGGRMVLVNFCVSKEGYFLGQTNEGASMWESFGKAWQKLYDDGEIDETELTGVSFPNFYRTTQEFLEGVEVIPSLKVISHNEHIVPCPYREQWRTGKCQAQGIESPKQYAEWFVPTTRTWSHSTFASALRPDRDNKEQVLQKFWQNYMDLVEEKPDDHGMDYVHNYLVIEKVEEAN